MALLEQWQKVAYNEKADRGELQRFWQRYFLLEKGVYEQLLTNPDEKVEGTVKELAEKYNLSVMEMTGFLDGINDSLVELNHAQLHMEWCKSPNKRLVTFHRGDHNTILTYNWGEMLKHLREMV